MIDVTCPKCRVELEVPNNQAGGRVTCPECEHTFPVPRAGAVKPARPTATKAEPPPRGPRSASPRPPTRGGKHPRRRDDDEDDRSGSGSHLGLILGLTGAGILVVALIAVGFYFLLRGDKKTVAQNNAPITQQPIVTPPQRPVVNPPIATQPVTKAPNTKPVTPPPVSRPNPGTRPSSSEGGGLYRHVLKSTVWLVVPQGGNRISWGAGFLIDKRNRLVMTNYHVLHDAPEVAVLFPLFKDGKPVQSRDAYVQMVDNKLDSVLKGRAFARDAKHDLAIVQLGQLPEDAEPLGVAENDVEQGQTLHSMGNSGAGDMLWVFARGEVRSVAYQHRWKAGGGGGLTLDLESDAIMTDSPTNPGDSGGPLVNDRGELVGVTHGGNPGARGISLFINRTEVIRFLEKACLTHSLTWDRSDRKLEGGPGGGASEADVPTLVQDLSSTDSTVRAKAASTLGGMGAKAKLAVPDLAKLLKDPDKFAKHNAAEALAEIGPEARPAADALIEVLKDSDASMRVEAARALGKIGQQVKSQAFPALAGVLEDSDKEVRRAALEAMASLGPLEPADLPVVLKVFNGTDPELRSRAALALGQFPAQAKEIIPQLVAAYNATGADKQLKVAVVTSLSNFGPDAVVALPVLTDALKSGQPELLRAACHVAAKLGPAAEKLAPELGNALEKGDVPTKKEVLSALQKLGPAAKDAAPGLAKVLGEKEHDLRTSALAVVEALGKDGKAAAGALVNLFADERDLRDYVMKVLTKMGKDAVSDLVNGLSNPNPNVRLWSARTLGGIGKDAKAAARKLGILAQTDPEPVIQAACVQAYQSVTRR